MCGFPNRPESLEKISTLMRSESTDWISRFRLHRLRDKNANAEIVELADFAVEQNWTDLFALLSVDTKKAPTWDWRFEQEQILKFGEAICKRCSYQEQERLILRLSKHRAAISLIASLCERGALSRDALRVLPKSWWESLPQESIARLESLRPEPSPLSNRLTVVESKASAVEKLGVDLQVGAKQFADRCAVCHKLGEQGKVVGPQLEGAGARGILRLCEDILWPDRNVDEAFKMTMMVLDGGESVSGLVSDRTTESLLLTDQTGKQRRILLSDIEHEKPSKLSLMPGNFDELMTDAELASLIGYLRNAANVARHSVP
jgi:putative heme-binding domain-containing protein